MIKPVVLPVYFPSAVLPASETKTRVTPVPIEPTQPTPNAIRVEAAHEYWTHLTRGSLVDVYI